MKKTYKISLLIILLVVAAGGLWLLPDRGNDSKQGGDTTTTTADYFRNHSDSLDGRTIDYYPERSDVSGYLSVPEGANQLNNKPGIILIHEWWGLNEDIKQMADDYADQGYVALAVDMYGQPPTSSSTIAQQRSQQVRNNMDAAMSNLRSAVDYLESRSDVDSSRLATVGWCFGGGWAYQMAVNDIGVDASVMYYGQFDPQDDFENMRASILGHFGEEDAVIDISNAREFKAELENAGQSSSVYIYPNVGHSFANYQGGDNLDYDPEAAETAWNRTLEFLNNQLGTEAQPTSSTRAVDEKTTEDDSTQNPDGDTANDTTVRYTGSGFTPQEVTISVGDTVRFVNETNQSMWVASDRHPTHTQYAGTSLEAHCSSGAGDAFDQCGSGDEYEFTFEKSGSWSYHNHRLPGDGGTVIVE